MGLNSLTNYGEKLLLERSINWDEDTGTHDVLELRLYFQGTQNPTADGLTGFDPNNGGNPLTESSPLAKSNYEHQPIYFLGATSSTGQPGEPEAGKTYMRNKEAVTFGSASLNWRGDGGENDGELKYMAIWNTSLNPEKMIWYGNIKDSTSANTTKRVDKDDTLKFDIGKIELQLD